LTKFKVIDKPDAHRLDVKSIFGQWISRCYPAGRDPADRGEQGTGSRTRCGPGLNAQRLAELRAEHGLTDREAANQAAQALLHRTADIRINEVAGRLAYADTRQHHKALAD
jgi:hypothetical protein